MKKCKNCSINVIISSLLEFMNNFRKMSFFKKMTSFFKPHNKNLFINSIGLYKNLESSLKCNVVISLQMLKLSLVTLSILFLCFCLHIATAQSQLVKKLQASYPDEKAVFLQKSKHLRIGYAQNQWQITAQHYSELLHLAPYSAQYAIEHIPFSQFSIIRQVEAKTLVPEGKGYKTLVVKDFQTKNLLHPSIFFDDQQVLAFTFPAIGVGAKTILQYQEQIKDEHLLGVYYFNGTVPTEKSVFSVSTLPTVKLNYQLFGCDSLNLIYKTFPKNGEIVHEWTAKNVKKYKNEPQTAVQSADEPHLVLFIEGIQTSPTSFTPVLPDVAALYAWYQRLTKENMGQLTPTLQHLADSLTKTAPTTYEKANILYGWVQKNIRYLAFEDGLGGLVPRKPQTVFEKRYGDCKDMTNLLLTLARAVGVEAYPAWVGTRQLPYLYTELPVPLVDNHLVAAFYIDHQIYFADATEEYLPFGMPSAAIQGKQALIGKGTTDFSLETVPVINFATNLQRTAYDLQFIDNELVGTKKTTAKGYFRQAILQQLTQQFAQQKPAINKQKKNSKEILTPLQVIENEQDSLQVSQQLTTKGVCQKLNHELFLSLYTEPMPLLEVIDEQKRQTAFAFAHTSLNETLLTLQIPPNLSLDALPTPKSFEHEKFGFHLAYEVKGQQLLMRKTIKINTLALLPQDFAAWNNFVRQLQKALQERIVLVE